VTPLTSKSEFGAENGQKKVIASVDFLRVLEFIVAILGSAAAIAGVAWGCWVGGRRFLRLWSAIDRLHVELGDDPVGSLIEAIRAIEASHGEIEIRQRISERHLAIGIYVCESPTGKCTWANDWLCHALGLDSREIKGWGWLAAIAKEDQRRVHDAWSNAVEQELPYEERYTVEPDGEKSWVAITEAWPVKQRDVIVCYVGYVTKTQN